MTGRCKRVTAGSLTIGLLLAAVPSAAQSAADAVTLGRLAPILSTAPQDRAATGLLPTALNEARAAATQAVLARRAEGDLQAVQQHAANVIYAVDPARGKGGGASAGYGVKRAVAEIQAQLTLVQGDARADVRRYLPRAQAAATNVLRWCDELVAVAERVRTASDPGKAQADAATMLVLAQQLTVGRMMPPERAGSGDRLSAAVEDGGLYALQMSVGMLVGGRTAPPAPKEGAR